MQRTDPSQHHNNFDIDYYNDLNNTIVQSTDKKIQDLETQLHHWIMDHSEETDERKKIANLIFTAYKNGYDTLALHDFETSSLPEALGELKQLKSLHIINASKLTELPHCIGEQLFSLKEFHVINTPINALPNTIAKLWLEKLVLHQTNIREMPECIRYLPLKELTLSAEEDSAEFIPDIPSWFFAKISFKKLILDNAFALDSMDGFCELTHLEELSLCGCGVEKIPDNIKNLNKLRKFNISFSQLTQISPFLGSLMNLKELVMSRVYLEEAYIQMLLKDNYELQSHPHGLSRDQKGAIKTIYNYEKIMPNSVANLKLTRLDVRGSAFSTACINKFFGQCHQHATITIVLQSGTEDALQQQNNAIETAITAHHVLCKKYTTDEKK